ncbi:MAG: hypothetical protein LBQ50_06415 [Planctomycetaceae bacterium]|jgi:hypothetical protein|nr:hypothetical protein [Planctomycetaceae bacterium]
MPNTSPLFEKLGFLTVIDQPRLGLIGGYLILNQAGRPLEFHCTTPLKPNRTQEILYGNTLEPFLYGEQIAQTLLSRAKVSVSYVLTNAAAVLAVQEHIETPVFYVFETGKKQAQPVLQPHFQPEIQPNQENNPIEESEEKINDLFPEPKTTLEISEELNASLKSFGIENAHLQTRSDDIEEQLRIPAVPGLNLERWREVRIGNRFIAVPTVNEAEHNPLIDNIKQLSRTIDLAEPFTRIRLAIEETQRAA